MTDEEFLNQYPDERARLEKVVLALFAARQARHALDRLNAQDRARTMGDFLENEMLATAFATAYGRLYTETNGVTKLTAKQVPKEHRAAHYEIMDLRHKRHAHHGAHPSVRVSMRYKLEPEKVGVGFDISIEQYHGEIEHWEALMTWLDEHFGKLVAGQLNNLTKLSGRKWIGIPIV